MNNSLDKLSTNSVEYFNKQYYHCLTKNNSGSIVSIEEKEEQESGETMPIIQEDVRKLATIETISRIEPIVNADNIVTAKVRGWNVVVKKNEFKVGDKVIYFEVDTALPLDDPRYEFLAPRGTKEENGKTYHVLKTARLRGVYSQGMVLPYTQFVEELETTPITEGTDVTAALNLGKWEDPMPVGNGDTAGAFLTEYACKTDSERVQNLTQVYDKVKNIEWTATEKVDGTSCTVVRDIDGNLRVMSRNLEIKEGNNTYWNVVKKFHKIFDQLENSEGFQFEIVGPGIQGNKLQLSDIQPMIFSMVRNKNMVPRSEWSELTLKHAVPTLQYVFPDTVEEMIVSVDGMKSIVNPKVQAEGIVFHTVDGSIVQEVGSRDTFKVINNKFLLKK